MWLQTLHIKGVRNLKTQVLEFKKGAQVLLGDNGSGKTSCLEAIGAILTGYSFRSHYLKEMIAHDSECAEIQAHLLCRDTPYLLQMQIMRHGKRLWLNRRPCLSWAGLFPCTYWVPEDIDLVRGGPSGRRKFLDHSLQQIDPLYIHHLGRYSRALEQRQAMLKSGKIQGIEVFEAQMALSATYIVKARIKAVETHAKQFNLRLQVLGFTGEHNLSYEAAPKEITCESYQKMWQDMKEQELRAKQTLKGPHLDDMKIIFQGSDARRFASEGGARGCVAALKMAQAEYLRLHEGPAILLIDEIGMGFDELRRASVWSWTGEWPQSFLSTPSKDDFSKTGNFYYIEEGKIIPYKAKR